jgi:transcriptional regulator with XRE-family HTH domain
LTDENDFPAEPTERRRKLAALLVRLRESTGLNQTQFGLRLGIGAGLSQPKMSRLERGVQLPTREQADAWAAAAGADPDQREDLLDQLEAALTESASWLDEIRHGVAAKQRRIAQVEQAASVVRTYSMLVPGLLQTAEYTRRLFDLQAALQPDLFPDPAAGRAAWAERQQALYTAGRRYEFVVPEAALWWQPGPDAAPRMLAAQIRQMASLSTLDTVRFGIIPQGAAALVCVTHGFTIVGEPSRDHEVEVTVDTVTRELHIRDEPQIAAYLLAWDRLSESAVYDDDARDLLSAISAELMSR